jgi:DHA1 family tetracycline resistance protein-like MFS transporter
VGAIFFYIGVVLVLVQGGLIGRLTKRYGEARLVVGGAAAIGLGLLALPFALSLPVLLVVSAFLAVGMGILNPAVSSLVSREAEIDERGGIMGVSQSASSLARIVGPALAGFVYGDFGRDTPYYLGAVVLALVLALALRLPRARAAVPGEAARAREASPS